MEIQVIKLFVVSDIFIGSLIFMSNKKFGNLSLAVGFWLPHKGTEEGNKSVNRRLY